MKPPIPVLNPELRDRYLSREQIDADIEFFKKKLENTPENLRERVRKQLALLEDALIVYRLSKEPQKTVLHVNNS
jgi:hypothetical protein